MHFLLTLTHPELGRVELYVHEITLAGAVKRMHDNGFTKVCLEPLPTAHTWLDCFEQRVKDELKRADLGG